METKIINSIEQYLPFISIVVGLVQYSIFNIVKSIQREIDKQDKRIDGIETRLGNCWTELSDCKDRCSEKRGALRRELHK
jgi:tetrahydromethanopterin S-methyltransferase subunit G